MEIHLDAELNCSATRAFNAWLSEKEHKAMVSDHPDCEFDVKEGGKWKVGSLEGVFKKIDKDNNKIVMSWQYSEGWDYPESRLTVEFTDIKDNKCKMFLAHLDVPEDLHEEIEWGWEDYYISEMQKYLKI